MYHARVPIACGGSEGLEFWGPFWSLKRYQWKRGRNLWRRWPFLRAKSPQYLSPQAIWESPRKKRKKKKKKLKLGDVGKSILILLNRHVRCCRHRSPRTSFKSASAVIYSNLGGGQIKINVSIREMVGGPGHNAILAKRGKMIVLRGWYVRFFCFFLCV